MTKRKPSTKLQKRPAKGLFSHHRHTGKVLHHRHTSYPLVALLLLMTGMLLLTATLKTRAATVTVTAAANGPLPPSAAVILVPKTGDKFMAKPILVSGTCPAPYFVKLFRNQVFSGSTQCNSDGTFQLYTDLFEGRNDLEARIYNAADQEGPRSNVVTVYYEVPALPVPPRDATPPTSGGPPAVQTPPATVSRPFFVTTDIFFKAIYENDEVDWRFDIVGGSGPFNATVAWGDGSISTLKNVQKRNFTVKHVYNRGPGEREYYPVAVHVTDVDGREASLQVFTILNNPLIPGLGRGTAEELSLLESLWRRILMAWPVYTVTTLMAISFWLGEKRGLLIWAHHFKWVKRRRPRHRHA